MRSAENRQHEFLAHAFENKYYENPVFKYYFPKEYEELIELLNKIL